MILKLILNNFSIIYMSFIFIYFKNLFIIEFSFKYKKNLMFWYNFQQIYFYGLLIIYDTFKPFYKMIINSKMLNIF